MPVPQSFEEDGAHGLWLRTLERKEEGTMFSVRDGLQEVPAHVAGDFLTSVKSQEVNLLVSFPGLASGSSLRENIQYFESLSETLRFTRICEDALFVRRVSAGMSYKTRPDEDDGFGQILPLCREYNFLE